MNTWFETLSTVRSGLVLGGGGARGCYEIGAWKALHEAGIVFDCTAGTSIGALVAAIYVQQTIEPLLEFADHLAPCDIAQNLFSFPDTFGQAVRERREIGSYLSRYILSGEGMDITPLKKAFDAMFSYEKFEASPIDYACMTFNVTRRRPVAWFKNEITAENAAQVILASASCFPAFPKMQIDGEDYIDGGYWNNIPCDLAVQMGAEKILAIDVEGPGIVHPLPKKADVLNIKPLLPLGNFLDFSAGPAQKAVCSGDLELRKLMGLLEGFVYSFEHNEKDQALMDLLEGYLQFMFMCARIPVRQDFSSSLLQSLTHFHPSDLSRKLSGKRPYLSLLEGLAWTLHLDAWKIWEYPLFVQILMEKAQEIRLEKMPAFDTKGLAWLGSLDKAHLIAVIHFLLQKADSLQSSWLQLVMKADYHEFIMACAWLFLERIWGNEL